MTSRPSLDLYSTFTSTFYSTYFSTFTSTFSYRGF